MKYKYFKYIVLAMTFISILFVGCQNTTINTVDNTTSENSTSCYANSEPCSEIIGAECINDKCECPEDSYYLGYFFEDSVNKCLSLNESFYVLDYVEGEARSFKYLKAMRRGNTQSILDSIVMNLYPTSIPVERVLYQVPVRLVFNTKTSDSGGGKVVGTTPIEYPVNPFHYGILIPDKTIAKIKWHIVSKIDSAVVSAEFYDYYTDEPLNKSMKLVFKRFER